MKRSERGMAAVAALVVIVGSAPGAEEKASPVEVIARSTEHRVDVRIGGKPFTAYLYGTVVKKPILFPLRTERGTIVTRGYPLEPRPGERADHPHHAGHWFNYGDVNGFDFWGHSDETPVELRAKAGTIVHTGVTRAEGGEDHGTLEVTADWVVPEGSKLLTEVTQFVFRGHAGWRAVDRTTKWTALDKPLVFGDTKEGAFGIRVARALEHPSKEAETFVGGNGQKETVPKTDNTGVTGQYLASDGRTGEAVWGTRGPWMALTGIVDGEGVTLAIFDDPKNPGYPTHWHARGYGLFAANPFGHKGFNPKEDAAPVTLAARASLTFRHRILIRSGRLTRDELQKEYDKFVAGSR